MRKIVTSNLLSIIVPVYNGGAAFRYCLEAIERSQFQNWELIVVNDGSTDESEATAETFGATILKTDRLGPGAARNVGSQVAKGSYLCFVDADCELHPDALTILVETLKEPEVDAVFGSYDDAPTATNFVAQYKNLFHHYIHQQGREEASTFWAGCGAVKSSTFKAVGGFNDQLYRHPSIEDIDLGYRIKQAGGKICLAKAAQVKHHKAWTLKSLIKTDVLDRGIPWTRLLLKKQTQSINDLNLRISSKISVGLIYILAILLGVIVFQQELTLMVLPIVALLLFINLNLYQFFYDKRGLRFSIKAVLMHWLYYLYSGASFFLGTLLHCQHQLEQTVSVANGSRQLKYLQK